MAPLMVSTSLMAFFSPPPLMIMPGCKNDMSVYQVNDVVSDPSAYSGDLTLQGVVYAFSKDNPSIVGVMDKKELQCKSPNCKKKLIAMQVTDSKLTVGDEVKASGSLIKTSGGYILKAKQVQVMENHKLGGA